MNQEKDLLFKARDSGDKRKNMSWWVVIVKSEQQHKNFNILALKSTVTGIQQEGKKPMSLQSHK